MFMPRALSFKEIENLANFVFDAKKIGELTYAFNQAFTDWNHRTAEGQIESHQNDYFSRLFNASYQIEGIQNILYAYSTGQILQEQGEWYKAAFMFLLAYIDEELNGSHVESLDMPQLIDAWKIFENLVHIFKTAEDASKFLMHYISSKEKTLRMERLLEWAPGAAMNDVVYLALVHHISSDIDLLSSDEYRNKFRTFTLYSAEFSKVIAEFNDPEKMDRLLENFAEMTYQDQIDKNKGKGGSEKYTPEQKQKYKEKAIAKLKMEWKAQFEKLFNRRLPPKDSINLCLEIAKYIARNKAKRISTEQTDMLFKMGVGPRGFAKLERLKPKETDSMPDAVIQSGDYFICKLSPKDIRGPFLGLSTGCCQHLEGLGATSAMYGYTNSNSCFYVMFKGVAPQQPIDTTKLSNKIVAQAWAWKSDQFPNAIVLDSIEASGINNSPSSIALQQQIRHGFFKLSEAIATDPLSQIDQVRVGFGGTVGAIGITAVIASDQNDVKAEHDVRKEDAALTDDDDEDYSSDDESIGGVGMIPIPKAENNRVIYSDAETQQILYDKRFSGLIELKIKYGIDIILFIYLLGYDATKFCELYVSNGGAFKEAIDKVIDDAPDALKDKEFLVSIFTKKNLSESLVALLDGKYGDPKRFGNLLDIVKLYVENGANADSVGEEDNSILLMAIKLDAWSVAEYLLTEAKGVNKANKDKVTPLRAALSKEPKYAYGMYDSQLGKIIFKLLYSGADIDEQTLKIARDKLDAFKQKGNGSGTEEFQKIVNFMQAKLSSSYTEVKIMSKPDV
jgi:hypothetical protein